MARISCSSGKNYISRVSAPREHKIHMFELTCNVNVLMMIFDDFAKISDHFLKISEDFPNLFRRSDEGFRTFSEKFRTFSKDYRRLTKIAEDDRRRSEDVSIVHQQILV